MEEELAETQTKLQEIEEVARKLEIALRKRGDSEPPPDLSDLRSLNMSYKAKMAEELSSSLGTSATPLGEGVREERGDQEVLKGRRGGEEWVGRRGRDGWMDGRTDGQSEGYSYRKAFHVLSAPLCRLLRRK